MVFIIALLILPLPGLVLDLMLAISIALSLVMLLVALQTTDPLEFSSFPALLLLLTLFRLALNVASTRLHPLPRARRGEGDSGVRRVRRSAATTPSALVVFLILIVINFIVITKGAGVSPRSAARFTLDAMPGKQMAIDADLSAGLIDENQARQRREKIARSADFYGAMDGASKFVKRRRGGRASSSRPSTSRAASSSAWCSAACRSGDAVSEYTILTIGDGLVSQIPALLISTAAGIMVTHAGSGQEDGRRRSPVSWAPAEGALGGGRSDCRLRRGAGDAERSPSSRWRAARGCWRGRRRRRRRSASRWPWPPRRRPRRRPPRLPRCRICCRSTRSSWKWATRSFRWWTIAGRRSAGAHPLLRKQAALELGILIPPIRIRDDIRLPANEYVIKLRGAEVARGETMPRFMLALDTSGVIRPIDGIETVDPSFGMPARWIAAGAASRRRATATWWSSRPRSSPRT